MAVANAAPQPLLHSTHRVPNIALSPPKGYDVGLVVGHGVTHWFGLDGAGRGPLGGSPVWRGAAG